MTSSVTIKSMLDQIINQTHMYIWIKDNNYRYIYCNDHFAKAAGLDSPEQIIGKSDEQLYWKKFTNFIRAGDYAVLQGHARIHVPEMIETANDIKDVLVTVSQWLNKDNQCIGIVGSFVDITGKQLVKKSGYYDPIKKRYYFNNESLGKKYLAAREITVFKYILLGYTAKQMGEKINISPKTVESYIEYIRLKLQAKNKGEIIAKAIKFGLTQILNIHTHDMIITNP
jgi:PAS domain S-box-containing protein